MGLDGGDLSIRLSLFGWVVARVDVDLPVAAPTPVADRAVKGISRLWVRHMAS